MFRPRVLFYAPDEGAGAAVEEFNAQGTDVTPEGVGPDEAATKESEGDSEGDDATKGDVGEEDAAGGSDVDNDASDAGGDDPLAGLTQKQREWIDFGESTAEGYTPDQVASLAHAGHEAQQRTSTNAPDSGVVVKNNSLETDSSDDDEPVTHKELKEALHQGRIEGQRDAAFDGLVVAHPELNTNAQYAIKATIAQLEKDHPDATPTQLAQTALETVVGGATRTAQRGAENDRQTQVNAQLRAKANRGVSAGRSTAPRKTARSKVDEELDNDPDAINSGRALTSFLNEQGIEPE